MTHLNQVLLIIMFFYCTFSSANDCIENVEYFNNTFQVRWKSGSVVTIRKKNSLKDIYIELEIGKGFNGINDRHGNVIYKLTSILKKAAAFEYVSSFDERGIGGKLTDCEGSFVVDLETSLQ